MIVALDTAKMAWQQVRGEMRFREESSSREWKELGRRMLEMRSRARRVFLIMTLSASL